VVQHIQAISDNAVYIEWSDDVSLYLNDTITQFCSDMQARSIPGVVELVPAYKSVTIYYLPHALTYRDLVDEVRTILEKERSQIPHTRTRRTIYVPVYYGREVGPDLDRVADVNNLSVEDVIKKHQDSRYFVHMLGFLPGFPYLGGLDQLIATPRLTTVRQETPKGSVGIAHHQTGIYPTTSPGGWNIIGRTPLPLMDLHNEQPFLFHPGDYVQFQGVTKDEFQAIEQAIDAGTYHAQIHHNRE